MIDSQDDLSLLEREGFDVDAGPKDYPGATIDRRVDLAVALAFLVFGLWLWVASGRIRVGSVPDPIGSGGVSRTLAAIIIALSAYLVLRRLLSWPGQGTKIPSEGANDDSAQPASAVRAMTILGTLVLYLPGLVYGGYLLSTPVFVFVGLWVMQVRSRLKLVAVPIGYTLVSYALFVGVFGVLLPLGVLQNWDAYLWFHL